MQLTVEEIAEVAHQVNRSYSASLGDRSHATWPEAPDWQRQSAINGVLYHMENPDSTPSDSHESWLKEKRAGGWKYGPVKDPVKLEHPCCVEFEHLPQEQKAKDYIFMAIVKTLIEI